MLRNCVQILMRIVKIIFQYFSRSTFFSVHQYKFLRFFKTFAPRFAKNNKNMQNRPYMIFNISLREICSRLRNVDWIIMLDVRIYAPRFWWGWYRKCNIFKNFAKVAILLQNCFWSMTDRQNLASDNLRSVNHSDRSKLLPSAHQGLVFREV